MPKVTEAHRQAMRERIHQATLTAFQTAGIQGVSMADIIRESGLSAGAIYGYYKSKDEIIAATAKHLVGTRLDLIDEVASRRPVPPIVEMVRAMVSSLPGEFEDRGLLLELWSLAARQELLKDFVDEAAVELVGAVAGYLAALARDQGVDEVRAREWGRVSAPAVAGLCQGFIVQRAIFGEANAERYLAAVASLGFSLPEPSRQGS